jgi:phosphoribosylaminoimidazole-succinocarboxamide synthase
MNLKPSYKGKVRDVYDLGESLVLCASDRISAFDVVFHEPVPDKGKILTRISTKWFQFFKEFENHLITDQIQDFPIPFKDSDEFAGRSVLVKKTKRIDFECVVRGYISGSAFKEYKSTGQVAFVNYPSGMLESERFPEPIFTPARKNDSGHDENISEETMKNEIGSELFTKLKETSISLYTKAQDQMKKQGIILCDTKFEFGLLRDQPILIDEILTPDSSRYWDEKEYRTGTSPASLDKQILRNWLESTGWNKTPPPPKLSDSLITELRAKYLELEEKINTCLSLK